MYKKLIIQLLFPLILIGLLAFIPIQKLEAIGDFFEKIISPVSYPFAAFVATRFGIIKYKEYKSKKDKED